MPSAEYRITIPENVDRATILGISDRHIKMIRETLDVKIGTRQSDLMIQGSQPAVTRAASVIEHLVNLAKSKKSINRDVVLDAIVRAPDMVLPDNTLDFSTQPAWTGPLSVHASGRPIRPKTDNQKAYLEAIRSKDLVFAIGPAGTGKTYLAVAAALQMLRTGRVKRLVLARPAVEAGERLGFLPGDLQDKVNPYLRPLFDALEDMLEHSNLQRFITSDVIEVIPLAFMRGRTLNDAIMILDEAQNTTIGQMKMFLTRMGRRSKCIVTGDVSQIDLDHGEQSGLIDAARRLRRIQQAEFIALSQVDIVRHALVSRIVSAYGSDTNPMHTIESLGLSEHRTLDDSTESANRGDSTSSQTISEQKFDESDDTASGFAHLDEEIESSESPDVS